MLLLALSTLFGMGGLGAWLVLVVQERSFAEVLLGEGPPWLQVAIGLGGGALMARLAQGIIASKALATTRDRYAELVGPLLAAPWSQVLVALSAGAGEELLFRGALQHWLGVSATAILFVALHGYLDPRNRPLSLYGLFLTGCMLLFGYYARCCGLLAPMIAHALFDLLLIRALVRHWRAARG